MWHLEESGAREDHSWIKSGAGDDNYQLMLIGIPGSSCRAVAMVLKSLLD